jgi:hypothetical protein
MERRDKSYNPRPLEDQSYEQVDFEEYEGEIYRGIDMDGTGFLKLPKVIEAAVIFDFAKILTETSDHLNKPLPVVTLMHGWNEPLAVYSQNYDAREILANASVNKDYPDGIIRISPFFLKSEFTARIASNVTVPPLEFILAHEDFHIWQFLAQPDQAMADCKVLSEKGLDAWNSTRTEIDANEFGKAWIMRGK